MQANTGLSLSDRRSPGKPGQMGCSPARAGELQSQPGCKALAGLDREAIYAYRRRRSRFKQCFQLVCRATFGGKKIS